LAKPVKKRLLPDEAGFKGQAYENNHQLMGGGDEEILVPIIGEPVLPELTVVNAIGTPIRRSPKHLHLAK